MQLRPMTLEDYDAVMALLGGVEGVCLRGADERENIARYLARNPGMSLVAAEDWRIIGCVFGGHDGRRGYLQHLAVAPGMRGKGIARSLVEAAMLAIAADGIEKFHVDVLLHNKAARAAWKRLGWQRRSDIVRFSFAPASNPDA